MTSQETFQLSAEVAEAYESTFVPAFFAQWAPRLLDAAAVGPGQRVLDVACGTGIVARIAADRVAPSGTVVGVDLNPAMLAVAARVRPDVRWIQGDAGDLPLPDADVDVDIPVGGRVRGRGGRQHAAGGAARARGREKILADGRTALREWTTADGTLTFPFVSNVVTARPAPVD